jgi:hypothetical protein
MSEGEVGTIDAYNALTKLSEAGDNIENHHLIPKSVACILEVAAR